MPDCPRGDGQSESYYARSAGTETRLYSNLTLFERRVEAVMERTGKSKAGWHRSAGGTNSGDEHEPGGASRSSNPADLDDEIPSGVVRHDERGNAVWDTGRSATDSTSQLLRKLEVPHLEVEDKKEQKHRTPSGRDPGGGYDPYNQTTTRPRGIPPRKGR